MDAEWIDGCRTCPANGSSGCKLNPNAEPKDVNELSPFPTMDGDNECGRKNAMDGRFNVRDGCRLRYSGGVVLKLAMDVEPLRKPGVEETQ